MHIAVQLPDVAPAQQYAFAEWARDNLDLGVQQQHLHTRDHDSTQGVAEWVSILLGAKATVALAQAVASYLKSKRIYSISVRRAHQDTMVTVQLVNPTESDIRQTLAFLAITH